MLEIDTVTLSEAQYLLRRSQEEINRAIDRGEVEKMTEVVVEPAGPKRGKRPKTRARSSTRRRSGTGTMGYVSPATVKKTVRKLGPPELLYFALEEAVHEDLTPLGRKKLYAAIKAQAPGALIVKVGPLQLEVKPALKRLETRYRALMGARAGVVASPAHEPVLKGSDISVYEIAALAGGQTIEEILEDYPSLSAKKVQRAIDYAHAYPKKGRPYPKTSLKRALGTLAEVGVFDLPDEEAGAEPVA